MISSKKRIEDQSRLDSDIISAVKMEKPETVRQLVKLIKERHRLPEEEIAQRILDLQNRGKLKFTEDQSTTYATITGYVFSNQAYWYWMVVGLSLATVASIAIPEDLFP